MRASFCCLLVGTFFFFNFLVALPSCSFPWFGRGSVGLGGTRLLLIPSPYRGQDRGIEDSINPVDSIIKLCSGYTRATNSESAKARLLARRSDQEASKFDSLATVHDATSMR